MGMERLSGPVKRYLAYSPVIPWICPVHIACQTSSQKGVIQSGIELYPAVLCASIDPYAPEGIVPLRLCSLADLIECCILRLGNHILPGVLYGSIGKPYLDRDALAFGSCIIQCHHCTCTPYLRTAFRLPPLEEHVRRFGRCINDRIEVHRKRCPGLIFLYIFRLGDHISFHRILSVIFYIGILDIAAFSLTVTYIEYNPCRIRLRESIPLKSGPCSSSQLRPDPVILEKNRIISRPGTFIRMIKPGAETAVRVFKSTRHSLQSSCHRHQGNAPDLEFVQAREPVDRCVGTIVTYSLPALGIAVRTVCGCSELCKPERFRRRFVEEPAAVHRTYVRIGIMDKICRIPGSAAACKGQHCSRQNKYSLHFIKY